MARFISRLDDGQIQKLVRVSANWRTILNRRGYGTVAAGIQGTPSATDRVFLTATALAKSGNFFRLLPIRK